MRNKFWVLVSFLLLFVISAIAQPPPHPPPRGEHHHDRHGEWFESVDANKNGAIERAEFDADIDSIFKNLDANGDGIIDETERPQPPPRREDVPGAPRPNGKKFSDAPERPRMPPPFLMEGDDRDGKLTRAEFNENAARHFSAIDKNGDGVISREEADSMNDGGFRPPHPPPDDFAPPPAQTVEFLGAEMRFGDKLVKNAPFSAETVMENTRRLFDGSTVSTQNKGAIYRDGAGRTRREQSLETVGGFSLGNQAQKLIFITDANEGTQYFLDPNRKTARQMSFAGNHPPPQPPDARLEKVKTESLGTKNLESVNVEGTRETGEIPVGRIGNGKTLQIVTERWFSPELQIIVMSRHIDPFAGEQIFRLTNIRRAEPARELFNVPQDYKLEGDHHRRGGEDRKP